jgi:adenylate cyclase
MVMNLKKITKILLNPWTALATLSLLVVVRFNDPTFVESIKLRYFDTLITQKAPTQNNIYTVNIDEKTLDKYGQWPFNRQVYANLIEDLYKHNAGLVVFNVLMPEKDRLGGDSALTSVFKNHPVVIANTPSNVTKNTPKSPGSAIIGSDYMNQIIQYTGVIANIPELEEAAAGVGSTNTLPELDGVNRRIPLVSTYNGKVYPNLALETLRVASGDSTIQVKLFEGGVEKMRIPKFGPISTDALGRVWVDWSQKSQSVSAVDLPKDFGGSIVIVGVSAAGLSNPLSTAVGAVYPQDIQASLIGTIANGINIQRPDWADGAEILGIIVLSILAIYLTRWKHGYLGIFGIVAGSIYASLFLFNKQNILVDVTYPILSIVLVYAHAYTVKFITELNQKLQIKKQFGTYLSPALVEKLQKNPELLKLGGESRELSIMFTDVRGFTTISEHYGKDVQGLTQIMNRYMTAMTAKIIENNGTLDKYIGDAQMAFWNAPLDEPNHAKMAVKTALEMMESLDAFNKEIEKEGIPAFGMGLGINTGTVVVGNMGSSQRFDYTCLGDSVNLASRLEGQSKPYGVKMVLGSDTAEQVKDEYPVIELDCIAVKGKKEGVKIFTLATYHEDHYKLHKKYLKAYYDGNWDEGGAIFLAKQLTKTSPPEMRQYYANMIERMEEGKPENWDGTYRATSK